jgi:hypothetical protein
VKIIIVGHYCPHVSRLVESSPTSSAAVRDRIKAIATISDSEITASGWKWDIVIPFQFQTLDELLREDDAREVILTCDVDDT